MAQRIGDTGMVLPDAPKLMFENALANGQAMSAMINGMMGSSLGEDDVSQVYYDDLSDEQKSLLDEWQSVTTKARLLPKSNIQEWVDNHIPLPALALLKDVRDAIPARPFVAAPAVIESYIQMVEHVAKWESIVMEAAQRYSDAFREADGSMTEDAYRRMHLAMIIPIKQQNYSYKDLSLQELLTECQEGRDPYYFCMDLEYRHKCFADVTLDDVKAADSLFTRLKEPSTWYELSEAIDTHNSLLSTHTPSGRWRQRNAVVRKLQTTSSKLELSTYSTTPLDEVLLIGKPRASRGGMHHRGIIRQLERDLHDNPDVLPIINRQPLCAGSLGLKPRNASAAQDDSAAPEDLPEGTPVDEDGKPLDQPRRPLRLDLSEQVKEMEAEGLEDTDEATFEDFRFLIEDYGFRGLQIGNYVPQKLRRFLTGAIHQSVEDLASTLKLTPALVALGNPLPEAAREQAEGMVDHENYQGMSLGLALGARGRGKAAAHYEPAKHIINMTRDQGAGSLAHEWGHALDNLLSSRLCDFQYVEQHYHSKVLSRVTGRQQGTGIRNLSEAYAIFWTLATNRHIHRGESANVEQAFDQFSRHLLKPAENNETNLAAIKAFGMGMKGIYAEEVPLPQLLRDHGTRLANNLYPNLLNTQRMLINLGKLHYGTSGDPDTLARLHEDRIWPSGHYGMEALIQAVGEPSFDRYAAIEKAKAMVHGIIGPQIEAKTGRAPHQDTLAAFSAPINSAINMAVATCRLFRLAEERGKYWADDKTHARLQALLEEKPGNTPTVNSLRIFKVGHLLMNPPADIEAQIEGRLVDIELNSYQLANTQELLENEISMPTPHPVEATMSTQPARIDTSSFDPLARELSDSLETLGHYAKSIKEATLGAQALRLAINNQDQQIRASRLTIHPRLLSRLSQDMNHRLEYFLHQFFKVEQEMVTLLELDDDPSKRPHPQVPGADVAASLRSTENLERIYQAIGNFDDRISLTDRTDLPCALALADLIRARLDDCLAQPTPATQYAAAVGLVKKIDSLFPRTTWNRTDNPIDKAPELRQHLDPYVDSFVENTSAMPQTDRNDALRTLYRGLDDLIGEQRHRLVRGIRSGKDIPGIAGIRQQGSAINRMITTLTAKVLERSLHLEDDAPQPDANAYLVGLERLARLCDEKATSFAYLTQQEREAALEEALAISLDWSPDNIREIMLSSSGHGDYRYTADWLEDTDAERWLAELVKSTSIYMHRKDMGDSERSVLAVLKGDFRKDLLSSVPQIQTSRMARASAAYEKRNLERNGHLTGSAPKYWCTPVEMWARTFETFVHDALELAGKESPYLVTVADRRRQDMQMRATEAFIAKNIATYYNSGDTVMHEDKLFQRAPTDYSYNYPNGAHRDSLLKDFEPLVKALQPCLAQNYPLAMELQQRVDARLQAAVTTPSLDLLEIHAAAEPASPGDAPHDTPADAGPAADHEAGAPHEKKAPEMADEMEDVSLPPALRHMANDSAQLDHADNAEPGPKESPQPRVCKPAEHQSSLDL